jgi:hypothetical protein
VTHPVLTDDSLAVARRAPALTSPSAWVRCCLVVLLVSEGRGRSSRDVPRRRAASVTVPWVARRLVSMKNQARWAERLARKLLEDPLPRRWAHVQGVAAQARSLAPMLDEHADLLEAAAYLHDIGYAPDLDKTGFHPLDGARYLRDVAHADPRLCGLAAHHSCAGMEAEERGLVDDLNREFLRPDAVLEDALAYCDMTTTPTGHVTTVHDRLSEIAERYGPGDVVTRFIRKAGPDLVNSVMRTQSRLCAAQ